MTSATSQSVIDESTSLPVARIDAQEEDYAQPLREYLELNGCTVFINQNPHRSVEYHIVCGDYEFVKGIYSSSPEGDAKELGIVIGLSQSDAKNLVTDQRKILVVDPVTLTQNDVVDLFSFFFASTDAFYDKRRNRHELILPDIESAPLAAEPILPEADRERIGSILSDVFRDEPKEIKSHKQRKRKPKIHLWTKILVGVCVLAFPLVWYLGSLTLTVVTYSFIGVRAKNGDVSSISKIITVGRYWLSQSKFAFGIISTPVTLVGLSDHIRGQERLLSFLTDIDMSLSEMQKMVLSEKSVASILLKTGGDASSVTPANEIHQLRLSVTSVQGSLGLAQAELGTLLRDGTFPFFLPQILRQGNIALQQLESMRGVLTYVDQVLTLYPHLSGFKESKTYLVLFQNSNELRPTGGFIGSVGIAKFEDGFLSDFKISDVYALDGQLKGHVDPPLPIRELLSSEHWYLRDSNWDPDFKVSAERASWFYEKESGNHVDGVIAVNVPVVVDVLKATGPIVLPDYNDRISADNFFGKSLYYTQANSFPGSTQKSDFLGALARTLMTKITTDRDVSPVLLFRAFASGISRRDILFMFTDSNLQQLVEHFGWSGRVFNTLGCEGVTQESCLFDQLAIAESNMSVSKVNYFIKRSSIHEIIVSPDGGVSENVTINLRNTVNLSDDPNAKGIGGPYTTYMRFFVPTDSSISDVTLDGAPVPSRNKDAKNLPVLPYIEKAETSPPDSQGIGVAFSVAPGTEKQVRISYKRMRPMVFGRGGGYLDLIWYKHPGVSDNQAKTIIRYPIFWVATDESSAKEIPVNLANDGQLEYNTTILKDESLRIKFTK
jgi:hypothetical protein